MFVMLEGWHVQPFKSMWALGRSCSKETWLWEVKNSNKKAGPTPGPSSDVNPPSQEDQEEAGPSTDVNQPSQEDQEDDNDDEKDDQDQSSDTDSSPEDMLLLVIFPPNKLLFFTLFLLGL